MDAEGRAQALAVETKELRDELSRVLGNAVEREHQQQQEDSATARCKELVQEVQDVKGALEEACRESSEMLVPLPPTSTTTTTTSQNNIRGTTSRCRPTQADWFRF
mmetsp:Transcript_50913/g.103513  ORF Transcript_50913/g.103513 Transcript_50913/m.103513 type:complete len:106 (-) Transcript_50913:173-490(-)